MLQVTTMNSLISDLVHLYAPSYNPEITILEDFDQLTAKASFRVEISPDEDAIKHCLAFPCNECDHVFWYLAYNDETIITYDCNNPDYETIDLDIYKDYEIDLVFIIQKNNYSSRISIYCVEAFTDFLEELDLKTALSMFDKYFNTELIFRCYIDSIIFHTETIAFTSGEAIDYISLDRRIDKCKSRQLNSIWSSFNCFLFPSDFNVVSSNNERLKSLFDKIAVVLSAMSVCDYTEFVDKSVKVKLNGYKMQLAILPSDTLRSMTVDLLSKDLWCKIASWTYSGGSIVDKLNIARNIISLNSDFSSLSLNSSTFSSIISNYKIFEKENVREYIELRNSVSGILLDLQSKASEIVESYIGQFKQSLLAILSFLTTVIILNVITAGDFKSCFTTPILWILTAFVVISAFLMTYYRWEVTNKLRRHFKQHKEIKDRYKDLFSPEELEYIFKDYNNDNKDSNIRFVNMQISLYTAIWKCSLLVVLVIVIFMWLYNICS